MFPEFLYNIYYKFSIVFREKNGSFSHEQTRINYQIISLLRDFIQDQEKVYGQNSTLCHNFLFLFLLDNVDRVQKHITILVRTAHGKSRGLSDESE